MSSVNVAVAFGAGVTSFLAPCTLALVPAFVTYLAGFTLSDADKAKGRSARLASTLNTLTFVLGFTLVFVALGSSLGALSRAVGAHTVWLNRVGGVLIIGFGLASLGLLQVPLMERGFSLRTDWPAGSVTWAPSSWAQRSR